MRSAVVPRRSGSDYCFGLHHLRVAGFVLKRAAATDLIPAVKEVLQGGTYVCPALVRHLPTARDQSPAKAKDAPPVD